MPECVRFPALDNDIPATISPPMCRSTKSKTFAWAPERACKLQANRIPIHPGRLLRVCLSDLALFAPPSPPQANRTRRAKSPQQIQEVKLWTIKAGTMFYAICLSNACSQFKRPPLTNTLRPCPRAKRCFHCA